MHRDFGEQGLKIVRPTPLDSKSLRSRIALQTKLNPTVEASRDCFQDMDKLRTKSDSPSKTMEVPLAKAFIELPITLSRYRDVINLTGHNGIPAGFSTLGVEHALPEIVNVH